MARVINTIGVPEIREYGYAYWRMDLLVLNNRKLPTALVLGLFDDGLGERDRTCSRSSSFRSLARVWG